MSHHAAFTPSIWEALAQSLPCRRGCTEEGLSLSHKPSEVHEIMYSHPHTHSRCLGPKPTKRWSACRVSHMGTEGWRAEDPQPPLSSQCYSHTLEYLPKWELPMKAAEVPREHCCRPLSALCIREQMAQLGTAPETPDPRAPWFQQAEASLCAQSCPNRAQPGRTNPLSYHSQYFST